MMSRKISPVEIVNKLAVLAESGKADGAAEEALWFLQFESTQKGGLERLAKEIVQRFPDRIGPEVVRAAYGRKRLTRAEAVTFWKSVPYRCGRMFEGVLPEAWVLEAEDDCSSDDLFENESERMREARQAKERREQERKKGLPEIDLPALMAVLQPKAETEVAKTLFEFCVIPTPEPYVNPKEARKDLRCWVFPQLSEALSEFMRERASEAQKTIAQTAVVKKVFDALDFAWEAGVMVQIEGDPRHGKTEAISTYCAMHRGRARLVTVPCENSDADFFLAIAEGLGIEVRNSGNISAIRREIDFVLTNSRLMLIWDEAHFLIPSRYSESTPPSRMNWLRTRVADRGLPTALMITPQSFGHAFNRFIKKTKYRFEQFFGRIAKFELPETLTREDVIAVAQNHFPEIALPYLKMIAGRAMQCAGYLQAVTFTAQRARHLAKKAGREGEITEADIERAIIEMMPIKPDAARQKRPCTPVADQMQAESDGTGRAAHEEISSEEHADSRSRIESLLVA